jgi:hypothetical protein
MTKRVVLMAILAVALMTTGYIAASSHTGSWTGEVVDVSCLVAKGGKGSEHADCGAKCVKAGLPVGLLVKDTVYLLISADHKSLNATLADHVSHTVTVTGAKYEHPGANVIEVKDWKMASK